MHSRVRINQRFAEFLFLNLEMCYDQVRNKCPNEVKTILDSKTCYKDIKFG